MRTHNLKCWTEFFGAIVSGEKTFEIRNNDRFFKVGDRLILEEYDPEKKACTGRLVSRIVTYITTFEQRAGNVVMGLREDPEGQRLGGLCPRCGGAMWPGLVLVPKMYGSSDFGGDFGADGTTRSEGPSDGKPRRCMKCEICGHSFTV